VFQKKKNMKNKLKTYFKTALKRNAALWRILIALKEFLGNHKIKYLAHREWVKGRFKTKRDVTFFRFKYFYRKEKNKVKIILVDFTGYPLFREKEIFESVIKCGIGNLFENMNKFYAGVPLDVTLVINSEKGEKPDIYNSLQKKYNFIENIIFSDNTGFDFGAYNKGYQYLRSINYQGDVLFMNSSARGPFNDYWLLKYSYLFHKRKNIGLCGISLNSHATHMQTKVFLPHVQSFFMYTNMEILTKIFKNSFPASDIASYNKLDIISKGEIAFSQAILNSGYGICSKLFENFVYYNDSKWEIPEGDTRYNRIYNQFANKI
jgi:hypothetical protein